MIPKIFANLDETAVEHLDILREKYRLPNSGLINIAIVNVITSDSKENNEEISEIIQSGKNILPILISYLKDNVVSCNKDKILIYDYISYAAQFMPIDRIPLPDDHSNYKFTGEEFLLNLATNFAEQEENYDEIKLKFIAALEHAQDYISSENVGMPPFPFPFKI